MNLPEVTMPIDLAGELGWPEARLRRVARVLGACVSLGNRMRFLPEDVAKIKEFVASGKPIPASPPKDRRKEHVYFILNREFVKIGWTSNWRKRLDTLQRSSPIDLEVLAVYRGGPTFEKDLHLKFSHLRVRGEWFKDCQEIREYIRDNKSILRR